MTYPQENLDLGITESIFQSVMGTLQDASLSAKERVYLSYVTGRAGRQGVIFHQQQTLARDLGFTPYSVCRLEKRLQDKGRLKVFAFGDRTYRSPYVEQVEALLESERKEASEAITVNHEPETPTPEPTCPNCKSHLPKLQEPLAQTASQPVSYPQGKPAPEVAEVAHHEVPKRTCTKEPVLVQQPVQGKSYQQEQKQQVKSPPVDNPTDWFQRKAENRTKPTKNPFGKNRHLVKNLVDDLAERLDAWQSWHYLAKIVWNICEEGEHWLYQAASWAREEAECGRCHSKIGLFDWKLCEMGSHPLKT